MITGSRGAGNALIHCYLWIISATGYRAPVSILAPDVVVRLRRRRLGDIDGVGARKGLLQPLIEGIVQPALLGVIDLLGVRTWPGHGGPSGRCRGAIWRMAQAC